MAGGKAGRGTKHQAPQSPKEIPFTDLEAADREGRADSHAAGTPAGGTASGGLAGSNAGSGAPENADLENAMGSGVLDDGGEDEHRDRTPYAGRAGGAVGGTPAGGRSDGGKGGRGLTPGGTRRGDSTIGAPPDAPA
jgi:hypothetical protein